MDVEKVYKLAEAIAAYEARPFVPPVQPRAPAATQKLNSRPVASSIITSSNFIDLPQPAQVVVKQSSEPEAEPIAFNPLTTNSSESEDTKAAGLGAAAIAACMAFGASVGIIDPAAKVSAQLNYHLSPVHKNRKQLQMSFYFGQILILH